MKKFLSLVLSLAMAMSLVTVGAGAKEFKDDNKIVYDEAVAVISELGVVDGYESGNFNPEGGLTRGAAAKIICNLVLGPTTASALKADAKSFKDVPTNHPFAGYIAYCAQHGIINGYGNDIFKPEGSLTGNHFMKMLLGALGYDGEIEGFTGPNWTINVAKLAYGIGLDEGNDEAVLSKPITRQEAALYALNTLKATLVKYGDKTTVNQGDLTVTVGGTEAEPVKWETGLKNDGNIDNDGFVQFAEQYFSKLELQDNAQDEFARPSNRWLYKSDEIGVYASPADATYTEQVDVNTIYRDLNLNKTVAANKVTVYVDGVTGGSLTNVDAADKAQNPVAIKKGDDDHNFGNNGVLTQVYYDEDDGTVTITEVNTYVGEVVKNVAATSAKDAYVQIAAQDVAPVTGTMDFDTEETFKEESYVQYTYSLKENEIQSVAATKSESGTATKTMNDTSKGDKNMGITINGTDYKGAEKVTGDALNEVSVDHDYVIYLDQYGYILYVEAQDLEAQDYALVLQAANRGDLIGKKAELLFADGTTKVVETEEDYTTYQGKTLVGSIVSYKADKDNVYTLDAAKGTDKPTANVTVSRNGSNDLLAADLKIENGKASMTLPKAGGSGNVNVYANSKTIFVVEDVDDPDNYTAYTGVKNAPDVKVTAASDADVYYFCKEGSMATIVFIVNPDSKITIEDNNTDMLFLAGESRSKLINTSDDTYFELNAVVNNKIETVKVADDVKIDGTAVSDLSDLNGLFKSYSTNKHGVITSLTSYANFDLSDDSKTAMNGGVGVDKRSAEYTVILDTEGTKQTATVDDNAVFYYVDKDGAITSTSYKSVVKDTNDLVYAVAKDGMIQALIVEEVPSPVATIGVTVAGYTATEGTVAVDGTTIAAAGASVEYNKGDNAVLTVTPKTGYQVKEVKVDGTAVTLDNQNQYTIKNINKNVNVAVTFEAIPGASMTVLVKFEDNTHQAVGKPVTLKNVVADAGEAYATIGAKTTGLTAPAGYKITGADQYIMVKEGAVETVTLEVTALKTSATITCADFNFKADGTGFTPKTVTIDNNGTLTNVVTVAVKADTDPTNTAANSDLVVSLDPATGALTVAKADGVTLDATDTYQITLNGLAEDGKTAVTQKVTVTIEA